MAPGSVDPNWECLVVPQKIRSSLGALLGLWDSYCGILNFRTLKRDGNTISQHFKIFCHFYCNINI